MDAIASTWQRSGSARQVMARADLSDLNRVIERLEARGRLLLVESEVGPGERFGRVRGEARTARRPRSLFQRVEGFDTTALKDPKALIDQLA
jgi:3-polyprenyl-4-hydroxybenzoate decarboxylase